MFAPSQRKAEQSKKAAVSRKGPQQPAQKKARGKLLPLAPHYRVASADSVRQAPSESLSSVLVQTKLEVSQAGDALEQEADRVAESVMRMPLAEVAPEPSSERSPSLRADTGTVMRACSTCTTAQKDEDTLVQRKPGAPSSLRDEDTSADLLGRIRARQTGGEALSPSVRRFMEPRFGASFEAVRVHHDASADMLSTQLSARALTVNNDVFFKRGEYEPGTERGQRLIAHELTHVIQQGAGSSEASTSGRTAARVNAVSTPLVQRFETSDCSVDENKQLVAAQAAVRPAVLTTLNRIMNASTDTAARDALIKYFGASGPSRAAAIALRLLHISQGLPGVTAECEQPDSFLYDFFCGGNLAYVRGVPAFFGAGNIHVCQPQFSKLSAKRRMSTLVHEGAHRYIDASDEAYYDMNCGETSETRALSDYERLTNADSYGCLVETLG